MENVNSSNPVDSTTVVNDNITGTTIVNVGITNSYPIEGIIIINGSPTSDRIENAAVIDYSVSTSYYVTCATVVNV